MRILPSSTNCFTAGSLQLGVLFSMGNVNLVGYFRQFNQLNRQIFYLQVPGDAIIACEAC